ncbi:hypothetical protein [Streptomyces sp. JJ38]|uniref:hypothetical protein n=1 Tax=Streptomyces sp. JJ38 TaxID=2738128 RepID=UPI001C567B78|nr:hypothetical protein [Streptomyces sp. JJ38]MBW1600408.1 hypothetical protein [Streptomyces sp. JJ38]
MPEAEAFDPSVATWHWYSLDQALAATLLSRRRGELEQNRVAPSDNDKRSGLTWSSSQQAEHRSYAMASILATVAFLEASLNELLASASKDHLPVGGGQGTLSVDERNALTGLMKALDERSIALLARIQLVLHLLRRQPFGEGGKEYQDARLVVQLRNELVHYGPGWGTGPWAKERKLATELAQRKFQANPFSAEGHPFFPDRCLGHGCTTWAWNTVVTFTDGFFNQLGVTPIYIDKRAQLLP